MTPLATGPLQTPTLVVGVAALAGAVLVLLAFRELLVAARYRSRRPTPISTLDADSGRVVVSGIARSAGERLTAPISGEPCLAYAWRVTDVLTGGSFDQSPQTQGRPHNVGIGRDATVFRIDDGTGSVLVEADGVELRLAEEWVENPSKDPVGEADLRTGGGGFGAESWSRRYYESRLDEGETVTVRGRVTGTGEGDDDARVRAGSLGVRISGGGTLVEDATPSAAARRGLKQAAVTGLTGLFVLAIAGVLWLVG